MHASNGESVPKDTDATIPATCRWQEDPHQRRIGDDGGGARAGHQEDVRGLRGDLHEVGDYFMFIYLDLA
jgi:hypothetical protein